MESAAAAVVKGRKAADVTGPHNLPATKIPCGMEKQDSEGAASVGYMRLVLFIKTPVKSSAQATFLSYRHTPNRARKSVLKSSLHIPGGGELPFEGSAATHR